MVSKKRHHLRVDVIKTRTPSNDLHVDVIRVVGYRGSCPCGWNSGSFPHYAEARTAARAHVASADA